VLDGLEQLDEAVITGIYALGGLINLGVTKARTQELKEGTYSE
jgi:hypothetical protein